MTRMDLVPQILPASEIGLQVKGLRHSYSTQGVKGVGAYQAGKSYLYLFLNNFAQILTIATK